MSLVTCHRFTNSPPWLRRGGAKNHPVCAFGASTPPESGGESVVLATRHFPSGHLEELVRLATKAESDRSDTGPLPHLPIRFRNFSIRQPFLFFSSQVKPRAPFYRLKVHRLKAMGSGDTNLLGRLKPAFAVAQVAAFRRRPFGASGSLWDLLKASPKGEGFHPSPMGTLNKSVKKQGHEHESSHTNASPSHNTSPPHSPAHSIGSDSFRSMSQGPSGSGSSTTATTSSEPP